MISLKDLKPSFESNNKDNAKFTAKCLVSAEGCLFKVKYVCMHCGKPLCGGPKCSVRIKEHIFRKLPDEVPKEGIHCPHCADKYHPFYMYFKPFRDIRAGIVKGWKDKFGTQPAKESAEKTGEDESETEKE